MININQLVVSKSYFLENLESFRKVSKGKYTDFISEKNTAFIAIPLVKIKRLNKINNKTLNSMDTTLMAKAFQLNFIFNLYSLVHRKKIFSSQYPYRILASALGNKRFIVKYVFNYLIRKNSLSILKNKSKIFSNKPT